MSEVYVYSIRDRNAVLAATAAETLDAAMAKMGYPVSEWMVLWEFRHMAVIQEREVTGLGSARGHRVLGVQWRMV